MSATELFFDTVRQLDARDGSGELFTADIYGSNIGDAGSLRLAASLNRNRTLKILNLGSNCIGDEGATAISKSLLVNTTLHTLHLHENSIGNDTVFCLVQSLTRHMASLRLLNLASNAIDDNGAVALAQVFKTPLNTNGNISLTELNLSSNPIGNAGAIAISKMLQQNASLMVLDMSHCQISDLGGLSFAEALISNTRLQSLDLSFNGLSQTLGDQFLSSMIQRSEMMKLCIQGQGISQDILARVNALGPQPPPPPTKWSRPAPQGVMEAMESRMCESAVEKLKSVKGNRSEPNTTKRTTVVKMNIRMPAVLSSGANTAEVATTEGGNIFKKSSQNIRSSRAFRKSGSLKKSGKNIESGQSVASAVFNSDADTAHASQIEAVAANCGNIFKKTLQNVRSTRAFKTSGTQKESDKIIESGEFTCEGIQSSVENAKHDNKIEDMNTFERDTVLHTAVIEASVIVADAQAIATDIIGEAQKQLARVIIASKSKPVSFELAQQIATGIHSIKSKLEIDSMRHSAFYNSCVPTSTVDLCSQTKTQERVPDESCPIVPANAQFSGVKFMVHPSAPLGFQQCKLVGNLETTPVSTAAHVSLEYISAADQQRELLNSQMLSAMVSDEATNLDAISVSEASLDENHSEVELSAAQIERFKSFLPHDDTTCIDPLIHEPIKFMSLKSLPFLEMEHLSEVFHTEEATSIQHNEITGPMWFIKKRSMYDANLYSLPEHIIVKQFFEEINETFHQEFPLFYAIQSHHCITITHVLGNAGVPVGLVMEHLPLLLDEAMFSFSFLDAIHVLLQCSAALHCLHLSDVVHSNINTFSFVVSKDFRRVKLVEFAIDQCILSSLGFVHKQEPLFTAPEMSNEDSAPTISSDIYAFGMLIWRLFHPLSPLPLGNAPIAVSLAAFRGLLPAFKAGVPPCISDICHRCMSRDPDSRPHTMIDVINALSSARNMFVGNEAIHDF
jgi:hypothetical protein